MSFIGMLYQLFSYTFLQCLNTVGWVTLEGHRIC